VRGAPIAVTTALIAVVGCGAPAATSEVAPVTARDPAGSATRPAPTTSPAPVASTSATAGAPFMGVVFRVTSADLPHSWRPGCPVGPPSLRGLRLSHWGLDGRPHIGTMVVHEAVATEVIGIFERLYRARFPIARMEPVDRYGGRDDASMAADNSSGFNCRRAVSNGPPRWSAHAYGRAIDVNPVENPYLLGGRVLPPAGRAFLDRSRLRPGMAVAGGPLVSAFAAAGWAWGGRWTASPDYQHFSTTGG
jgi:hypothetical protein